MVPFPTLDSAEAEEAARQARAAERRSRQNAERARAEAAEKERMLAEVHRLADLLVLQGLEERARDLLGDPARKLVPLEQWLQAAEAVVDAGIWMPVRIEFDDRAGRPLKTIEVVDWDIIDGIPTPLDIRAEDHQRSHTTRLEFLDIEYPEALPQQLFNVQALGRGLPRSED